MLPLLAGVCVSAGLSLQRNRRGRISALRLGLKGELEAVSKVGAHETATVLPSSTVLPGLIVLHLRLAGRNVALVLPADATGAAGHRQLRLWLQWLALKGRDQR